MSNASRDEEALIGVDRAALIFAAAGSAASLSAAEGEFSPMASFFGVTFVLLVLAFHRPAAGGSVRRWLIRLAFGAALTTSLFLALGGLIGNNVEYFGSLAALIAFTVALVFAVLEPRFSRLLARP